MCALSCPASNLHFAVSVAVFYQRGTAVLRDVAHISGRVVRWARERARLDHVSLASKFGKGFKPSHISAWESGESLPTFSQAEKLAELLRVPFGVLFMEKPPDIRLPLPDLRTVGGEIPAPFSLEFFEVVSDALVRQNWYREYQARENNKPLGFVGRFRLGDNTAAVATDIAETLGIDDELRRRCSSWHEFLTELIERSEEAGILVMVSSVVRHATKRPLNVREFRGFTSADPFAPLIFLNGRDARAAMIFTIAHELAHVWIAADGISNPDPRLKWSEYASPIERYCNGVAAELLVPQASFDRLWTNDSDNIIDDKIARISSFHRVSRIVAIIRARELGALSYDASAQLIEEEEKRIKREKEKQQERDSGPSFWTLFPSRNSARLTSAVVSELESGRVLFREASSLLGVNLSTLEKYRTRLKKAG